MRETQSRYDEQQQELVRVRDIHSKGLVAKAALDFYREIAKNQKTTHPGSKSFGSVEAGMAFAKGEAALAINWFGFASMCEVIEESKVKGKVEA